MALKDSRLIFGVLIWVGVYSMCNYALQFQKVVATAPGTRGGTELERGRLLVENCANCHYIDQRANFVGPHLVDLVGRRSGEVDGFDYSPALKRLRVTWTHENLIAFLQAPQQFAPGTKMAVSGWSKAEAAAIVQYLESRP